MKLRRDDGSRGSTENDVDESACRPPNGNLDQLVPRGMEYLEERFCHGRLEVIPDPRAGRWVEAHREIRPEHVGNGGQRGQTWFGKTGLDP